MTLTNERGFIGRLFVFALLAGALWYLWRVWLPAHGLQRVGASLETSVNKVLVRNDVTDSAIVSQLHRERSRWGLQWVETERRIVVPTSARREAIAESLQHLANSSPYFFARQETTDGVSLSLSVFFVRFQTIVLMEKAPKVLSQAAPGPQVAFVIDDVAYDEKPMDRFAALGVPLTFAILPRDRHSRGLAEKAQRMNFAVILHLPMEPIDVVHNNPGSSALYLKMNSSQLHDQFEKDVASVPYIQGINNHMGSAFTSDKGKMALVMGWVKQHRFFFLDSRTTGKSVVLQAARHAGVPCLANETFLDNSDEVAAIEHQLDLVLRLALRHGQTIAIGHYRRKNLIEALSRKLPEFRARGVSFVPLPALYPHGVS